MLCVSNKVTGQDIYAEINTVWETPGTCVELVATTHLIVSKVWCSEMYWTHQLNQLPGGRIQHRKMPLFLCKSLQTTKPTSPLGTRHVSLPVPIFFQNYEYLLFSRELFVVHRVSVAQGRRREEVIYLALYLTLNQVYWFHQAWKN